MRAKRSELSAIAGDLTNELRPLSLSTEDQPLTSTRDISAHEEGEPQALTATFLFDSGSKGEPYCATVRFSGRRVDISGRPSPKDSFVQDERVEAIVPGSGPVSITARIHGINRGEYAISAEIIETRDNAGRAIPPIGLRNRSRRPLDPGVWSWRNWKLSAAPIAAVKTRLAPLIALDRVPAVIPGSWAGLVALGVIIGFVFQAKLLLYEHIAVGRTMTVSLLAVSAGLVGAKLWYLALGRRPWRESLSSGWCIQGFLLGAAVVEISALAIFELPTGVVLDATTPGLFVGLAIGRLGCFFTGCCAGRPTASRWAVWCSDRRVGARRVPTQLVESLLALIIGVTVLFMLLYHVRIYSGTLSVGAFATYTLFRQFLLRLRAEQRKSTIGGPITALLAALVLVFDILISVIRAH